MELIEFLLARIAEDEAAATDEAIARASAGTVVLGPVYDDHPGREAIREQVQEAVADVHRKRPWSSPWNPVRVLVECEAKRRIVEQQRRTHELANQLNGVIHHGSAHGLKWAMKALALAYTDHPDYRDEWRP